MKTKIIALLSFLVVNLSLFSQINTVREGKVNYNNTSIFCLEFEVEAIPKAVMGEWKSFLKKNHKVKLKKYIGGTYIAQNTLFEKISNKTIDVLTVTEVKDTTTVVKVFIGFGFDIYMNATDHPTEVGRLKAEMQSFLTKFVDDYYDSVLKPLMKKQKKIKKDLSKTQKEIDKANKNIHKNKSIIDKNEDKTSKNMAEIEKYNKKIKALNANIEERSQETTELIKTNETTEEEVKVSESEKEKIETKLNSVNAEIKAVQNKK